MTNRQLPPDTENLWNLIKATASIRQMNLRSTLTEGNGLLSATLACAHAAVLIVSLINKDPIPTPPCAFGEECFPWNGAPVSIIAERAFHWHYETPAVKVLMLADAPALLAGGIVFAVPNIGLALLSLQAQSYLAAFVWIVFGSAQWWLVGAHIKSKLNQRLAERPDSSAD